MKIERSRPRSLGVESLVYVGDVVPTYEVVTSPAMFAVGALGALMAVFGKKKTRLLGLGIIGGVGFHEYLRRV